MPEVDTIVSDFLIVGGGAAGCLAAIRARELDPGIKVTVLEKAHIDRSGAAGRGMDALNNVVVPGVGDVEQYLEAMEISFDGILDPAISRVIAERSFGLLKLLEKWGLIFPRDKNNDYIVNQFHPKGRFLVEMRGELKKILAARTKSSGAAVYNRHPVVKLIADDGRIAGAVALDLADGRPKAFLAPAVLLATGGGARIGLSNTGYLHGTFDCPWCNGESWRLGFEVGASLTGFEYTAQSSMTRDFNGAGQSTFIRHGAYLVNGLGERFMEKYSPELMERAPAGVRALAMDLEVKAGRGPVAFTFDHLSPETVEMIESAVFDVERPTMRDYFKNKGIDLKRDPVEVVKTEVYLCGGHGLAGFVADASGATAVPGLYAAGDSLSNPAGFLTGAMAMGQAVAERVVQGPLILPAAQSAEKALGQVKKEFERHEAGRLQVPVSVFEYKYRRLVNEYVAPPKSGYKLKRFLAETEAMVREQEDLPAMDSHGLMKVYEAKAGLFCARMAALASDFRTESRFGLFHQRVDYPDRDEVNWKTRVILSPGPDGPRVRKETS